MVFNRVAHDSRKVVGTRSFEQVTFRSLDVTLEERDSARTGGRERIGKRQRAHGRVLHRVATGGRESVILRMSLMSNPPNRATSPQRVQRS